MKINPAVITELKEIYKFIRPEIEKRLGEFKDNHGNADNNKIFEELSFCILSSGVGPKVAEKSVKALGMDLHNSTTDEIKKILNDVHKYPDRASYLVDTREYLRENYNYALFEHLSGIPDRQERRDFIAINKSIRGIGMVQASHFLRNTGFQGYSILDRNILSALKDFGILEDSKPPSTRNKYIEKENLMIDFSDKLSISIDELDLLLWYRKNNKIPR